MVPKFAARQPAVHGPFLFVSTFAGFIATLPRCPITLRQREIKRHWIRIKKSQCVRYSFGGYATSLHRSHCPPKRRLHGTLLHGASDAASTFSCISKKRCLNKRSRLWDTDLVPPKPCRDLRNQLGEKHAAEKKIRGQESLHNLRIDDSMEAGPSVRAAGLLVDFESGSRPPLPNGRNG